MALETMTQTNQKRYCEDCGVDTSKWWSTRCKECYTKKAEQRRLTEVEYKKATKYRHQQRQIKSIARNRWRSLRPQRPKRPFTYDAMNKTTKTSLSQMVERGEEWKMASYDAPQERQIEQKEAIRHIVERLIRERGITRHEALQIISEYL